jgi:hypothetical protein
MAGSRPLPGSVRGAYDVPVSDQIEKVTIQ